MVKVMMFAHGGSLNRGCEAIVRSTAEIIKDRIHGARVYLASGNPTSDTNILSLDGVYDGSRSEIKKYSLDWFLAVTQYRLLRKDTYALSKMERNIIQHIDEMDVWLSIGGDNYCYGEQPNWYEINRRVKGKNKKLVLWGCSIGEEDMSERKLQDLQQFDLILARETLTYHMLRSKGLSNVKLCADPAFTMDMIQLPLPEGWQENNTIGLNFSPLVWARNKGSETAIHDLMTHMINHTDMTIALTPHVMENGNNDYEILRSYYEKYKHTDRVILLPDHLNAMEYKGYIARMRFFIGARTHATIAAYSNRVPTMVLGYSVKSKGISKDLFGKEKLVLDITELSDSNKLIAGLEEMMKEENQIRQRLHEVIPNIQKMSYRAADYVKELA